MTETSRTGSRALTQVVAEHPPGGDPDELCDRILDSCRGPRPEDDIALLAVRITVPGRAG